MNALTETQKRAERGRADILRKGPSTGDATDRFGRWLKWLARRTGGEERAEATDDQKVRLRISQFRSLSKSDDSTFTESRSDHFFWLWKPEALSGAFSLSF